uniref:Uncharacterized protein n=1 Tax=Moniliophthora roreri TaxID=221103 RepID=A0A0W0FXV5_MONRR
MTAWTATPAKCPSEHKPLQHKFSCGKEDII